MVKKDFKNINYIGMIALLSLMLSCYTNLAIASIENPSNGNGEEDAIDFASSSGEAWSYEVEDRPDPFEPFVKPNVVTTSVLPKEEEVILTGMQLFEPGQLKLVAIMFTPSKKVAMVEDVTGKGYIIDEGTLIGRYGIVSQINLDQVKITETRKVGEKEVVSPVVMRLDKEGDK